MRFRLLIPFFLSSTYVLGQGMGSILDKSTNPGEVLVEFDNRTIDLLGSYYLFEDWEKGSLQFTSGVSVNNLSLNFNLENDMLEVKLEEAVKLVPLNRILKFEIMKDNSQRGTYKCCDGFLQEGDIPLAGLCEIIDSNYFGLIQRYTFDIQEATYIPALDMGNKDSEIIVKNKYFLTIGRMAYPAPLKKRTLMDLYTPYVTNLDMFISQNNLNPKNINDLMRILEFLNSENEL